jgi:hypothetical protein
MNIASHFCIFVFLALYIDHMGVHSSGLPLFSLVFIYLVAFTLKIFWILIATTSLFWIPCSRCKMQWAKWLVFQSKTSPVRQSGSGGAGLECGLGHVWVSFATGCY